MAELTRRCWPGSRISRRAPDGAALLARLHEAALADEEGEALRRELAALAAIPASVARARV